MDTYPPDSAAFTKKQKNRFLNPVGDVIKREIEQLFDVLVGRKSLEAAVDSFENIIKIRAVQNFSPQQAVGFVSEIKDIIRGELAEVVPENDLMTDLYHFEKRVDQLVLLGFDVYMKCREKINDIKINALKKRVLSTLPQDCQRSTENRICSMYWLR